MEFEPGNKVQTTSTTFRIMETLYELEGGSIAEITERVDCSKSTVYKHLNTLVDERYVVKEDGEYQLGMTFLQFGEYARTRHQLYHIAKPKMKELAEEVGEMSNLLVEENGRGILMNRESSDKAISLDTHAGKEVHLHCTANGKAILSELPEERVEEIIARHGLPDVTRNTITDRDELFDQLEVIRERGCAFDDEERLEGLRCVAVPLVSPDGPVLGAVSVSGPASRIHGERFREELPERLQRAQNVIQMNAAYS